MKLKYLVILALLQIASVYNACSQDIITIAGGIGNHGAATVAELSNPNVVATDRYGNIYIADAGHRELRKVTPSGVIDLFPLAPNAVTFGNISGIAIDTFGNLYVADASSYTIVKITPQGATSNYVSLTVAPYGIGVDSKQNLYICDRNNNRILKVDTARVTSTFAGTGAAGSAGDFGIATAAQLNWPIGVCSDRMGNIYIADNRNNKVRMVAPTGIITTYAGTGIHGYGGDGYPAISATFNTVSNVASDTSGNIYIVDNYNNLIRMVNPSGIVNTIAGTFVSAGFAGDGGPATNAQLSTPTSVSADTYGNLYIADAGNNRVRKVSGGYISTIAGCDLTDATGYRGDGGPAISALFMMGGGIAYDTLRNLYVADAGNNVIRKIDSNGIVTTIAGNGALGYSGDGLPATSAQLNSPTSVAVDKHGNIFIGDENNYAIRKIDPSGIITTYAGNGIRGFGGDGHRADSAKLGNPASICLDNIGNLYISDLGNARIRKVDTNQVITTIAGMGIGGYFGDGGPATNAEIQPSGACIDKAGNIYIAEMSNNRVRKIDGTGTISTFAGTGVATMSGLGGPASVASINTPIAIAYNNNVIYVSCLDVVVKIDSTGTITGFAGNGSYSYYGEGGPATAAAIGSPQGIAGDQWGNVYLTDPSSEMIHEVLNASIRISTINDTVCTGNPVSFTATATAAPEYSVHYHWYKNGVATGTDSTGYTTSGLANGDVILCTLVDSVSGTAVATSNKVTMTVVSPSSLPGIAIETAPNASVCAGITVTCSPISLSYQGGSPVFDWYKNRVHVYTGRYYSFVPGTNDTVFCKLSSSLHCLLVDSAFSLPQYITSITPTVPTASITEYTTYGSTLCQGTMVEYYLSGSFRITSSQYWFKNDSLVASGVSEYSLVPQNNDSIYCMTTVNSGCYTSDTAYSNGVRFTVNAPADPTVGIRVSPDTNICPGSKVTLSPITTLGGSSPEFSWYLNNFLVSTDSTYTFVPAGSDSVYCHLLSNSNCILATTAISRQTHFTYKATVPDSVAITASTTDTVCVGTMVQFKAIPANGGTTPTYRWYMNGALEQSSAADTFDYPASTGAEIYCIMISDLCAAPIFAYSNSVLIYPMPYVSPALDIYLDHSNVVCANMPVTATAFGTDTGTVPIYNWYFNDTLAYTGNSYPFAASHSGNLKCVMTTNAPCTTSPTQSSNGIYINVRQLLPIDISAEPATINFKGTDVVITAYTNTNDPGLSFQWYKNGKIIPGATAQTYSSNEFSINDSLYCVLTDTATCEGTVTSNVLGVQSYHDMIVYPNPSDGDFTISGDNYDANNDLVQFKLYNEAGQIVYEKSAAFDGISFFYDVRLRNKLAPGVYFLKLRYEHGSNNTIVVIK
jgi:sugar lactone lactonase YvrE